MKSYLLAGICFLQIGTAAPAPVIRASIASPRPIIVGQAVRVNVSVLVPNYFTGQPDFPQFNLDDAIVVLPGETPQNSNETIAGQTYAGISVTYLIYPQRTGSFKLPNVEIPVKYAADPPKSVETRVLLPPIKFEAIIPPQAADLDYFLPTTALTLTQRLNKPLNNLKVGDTFTRTITVRASKLRAMLIPPTNFGAPDGIAVYSKQPSVDDIKTDRGEFVEGRRVDSATYLIRKDGTYALPEVRIEWWDLSASKIRTAIAPAIRFEAAANPNASPAIAPEPDRVTPVPASKPNHSKLYLYTAEFHGIALVAGLLGWVCFYLGPRTRRRWNQMRQLHENTESAYFHRLKSACQEGAPEKAYVLLLDWLNRFRPGISLTRFLAIVGEPDLNSEVDSLSAALYRNPGLGQWSGRRMIFLLQQVRSREQTEKSHPKLLPPLNPTVN
jgi:hypothetical protein